MARLARLVIPGLPYHVTQRGNRRGTTFFEDDDFLVYREFAKLRRHTYREGASFVLITQPTLSFSSATSHHRPFLLPVG
jgi:REP element-mobilizing transposase RayT